MKPESVEKIADTLEKLAELLPDEDLTKKASCLEDTLDESKVLDFIKFFGSKKK